MVRFCKATVGQFMPTFNEMIGSSTAAGKVGILLVLKVSKMRL
jgi:hypothetical protein